VKAYHDLLVRVLSDGVRVPTRAKVGGEYVDAVSVFGERLRIDLRDGFPLVTTKRVHFDSVFHELVWFLRGDTDVRYLRGHGVTIWDEWADKETGRVGRMYGAQWRRWPVKGYRPDDGWWIDQIRELETSIRFVAINRSAPQSRRMIVTAWNPDDVHESALPPCHILLQLHLSRDRRLSCHVYQRSADLFLGVPFNIASYALLTRLLARRAGVDVGDLIFSYGDAHIYVNHLPQVETILNRAPRPLPTLGIDPAVVELDDLRDLERRHVAIVGYAPHPGVKGEVAV
jgi:thymidylate synthase